MKTYELNGHNKNGHKNGTGKKSAQALEEEYKDRRKSARLRPEAMAGVLTFNEEWWPVNVMDISMGGARILNPPAAISVDDLVYLTTCPDAKKKVTVACRVRHTSDSFGWKTIGVEFVDPAIGGFGPVFAEMDAIGKRVLDETRAQFNGKK